jgi:hypothetical protein
MTKQSLAILSLAVLATIVCAQDRLNPLPAKEGADAPRIAPPLSTHKTIYANEYLHSFKTDQDLPDEFHWHGLNPQECVAFEPEGLRITLPVGHPGKRMGTGIGAATTVRGDFEITMSYEIIKEPNEAEAEFSTGLFLWVDLNMPKLNRGFVSRVARPDKQFVVWYHLTPEAPAQPVDILRPFPAHDMRGKLRLVRTGTTLYHYAAEDINKEFQLLHQHDFGAADLQAIRWGGQTGGASCSIDGRFFDILIRADALPDLPSVKHVAVPGQPAIPPRGVTSSSFHLVIIGLALGFMVTAALGIGLLFWLRHRKPTVDNAVPSPMTDAPVAAVSFACPNCGKRLKVRGTLAGKSVKCPHCHHAAAAPQADAAAR